jgi:hypothetical protein
MGPLGLAQCERRPFNAPEEGTSFSNVQIEALLGYQFTNGISVAVGGRYWRIDSSFGQSKGLPQTISLNGQRWGGFLQASYKFGELRPLGTIEKSLPPANTLWPAENSGAAQRAAGGRVTEPQVTLSAVNSRFVVALTKSISWSQSS